MLPLLRVARVSRVSVVRASRVLPMLALGARSAPVARNFSYGRILANEEEKGAKMLNNVSEADLVAALDSEIRFEEEEKEEVPEFVTQFIKESGFKVNHPPNYEQVELVKKDVNGDVVRVFFSVNDAVEGISYEQDEEEFDVDEAGSETGSKSAVEKAEVEKDQEEEEEDEDDLFDTDNAPVRLNIIIEKASGSALAVEGLGQDGYLSVHSVAPYTDKSLALDESAEGEYKRRLLYRGPDYSSLDEGLQTAFEEYLDTKGVNADLLEFIYQYSVFKENEQYGDWLKQVRSIIAK